MAIDRRNVMRIMAVVTGGIGARLVCHAGPGMNGAHVTLDLAHDLAQPGVFFGGARLLGFIPQFRMALHATHFAVNSLAVGRLDDVLVAIHAIAAAVHTLPEGFSCNVQIALFTIGGLARKIIPAMATQAAVVGQLGIIRLGRYRAAECEL